MVRQLTRIWRSQVSGWWPGHQGKSQAERENVCCARLSRIFVISGRVKKDYAALKATTMDLLRYLTLKGSHFCPVVNLEWESGKKAEGPLSRATRNSL